MKLAIITSLIVAMIFTNVSPSAKVSAESGVGKDVFRVVVSLFGITNSTKDIVTLVNVKDQAEDQIVQCRNPETKRR